MLKLNPNLLSKSPTCNSPSPSQLSYADVLRLRDTLSIIDEQRKRVRTMSNKNTVDLETTYNMNASCQGTKNTNDNKRECTYWRQWNKHCHSCGVVLDGAAGCGTGGGKDCYHKKDGHKDAATFTNKLGGNTKRDHLWKLWCEPVTNLKFPTLPAGAKTTK